MIIFSPFILSLILTPIVFFTIFTFMNSRLLAAILSLAVGVGILFIGNIYLYHKLKRARIE
ncbi:MAG: hypothetical protein QXO33_04285 [Nitrososphaeria archaeon]